MRVGAILMTGVASHPSVELRDYLRVLRRRGLVVVLAVIMCAGLAAAYAQLSRRAPVYESSTTVLLEDDAARSAALQARDLDTEVRVVGTIAIAERAAERLDTAAEPEELVEHVAASVVPNTELLRITYRASSPEGARAGADAFAQGYLAFRQSRVDDATARTGDRLRAEIEALELQLAATQQRLVSAEEGSADRANASALERVLIDQLTTLRDESAKLAIDEPTPGLVLEAAGPGRPLPSGSTTRTAAVGAVLGLLIGLVLAFVRDRMDSRYFDAGEVEEHTRLPVLGTVPLRRMTSEDTDVLANPPADVGDAYRRLQPGLLHLVTQQEARVLLVSNASAVREQDTTSLRLALALSQTRGHVVLLLTDPPTPEFAKRLGIEADRTLADVIDGRATTSEVLQPLRTTTGARLSVVVAGPVSGTRSGTWQAEKPRALLAELRERADVVLIDAPAARDEPDALELAPLVDGVILTVTTRRSTHEEVDDLRAGFERAGGRLLAAVVLDRKHSAGGRDRRAARRSSRGAEPSASGAARRVRGRTSAAGPAAEAARADDRTRVEV